MDLISATNEKGASMTDYSSLSHKELFINAINDTKYYDSKYEQVSKPASSLLFGETSDNVIGIDLPSFDSGIKVTTEGYYKKENSSHVSIENTNEVLTNKIFKDPIIDGTLVVDKENTSFGFESNGANTGSYDGYTISGTMRSDGTASVSNLSTASNTPFSANLDYDASDIDGYYKGWTIQATTGNNTYYDTITDYPLFKSVINGKMIDDAYPVGSNSVSIKININDFDLYKYLDAGHIFSNNTITKRLDNTQKQTLAVNYFKGWKIHINDIEKTILTSEIDADGLKHTIVIEIPIEFSSWNSLKKETKVKINIPENIFYGTMSSQNTITSIGSITDSGALDFYKGWTIIMQTNDIRQSATITSSNNGLITYDRGGGDDVEFNFGDAASSNLTKYQLIPPKRIILSGNHLTTPNTSYILSPPRNNKVISSLAVTGCSEVLKKRITKTIGNGANDDTKELYLDNVENLKVGMVMYDSNGLIVTYTKSPTIQLIETDKVYGYFSATDKTITQNTPYYQTAEYYIGWTITTKNPNHQTIVTGHSDQGVLTFNDDITTTSETSFILRKNVVHLSGNTKNHIKDNSIQFYPVNKVRPFYGSEDTPNGKTTIYLNDISNISKRP